MARIYLADNMEVLPGLADGSVNLVYVDPPFNTGRVQQRTPFECANFSLKEFETFRCQDRELRDRVKAAINQGRVAK